MGARLIVLLRPFIEVGMPFVDGAADLPAEGQAVERVQRRLVEMLIRGGVDAHLWGDTPQRGEQPGQRDPRRELLARRHRILKVEDRAIGGESPARHPPAWPRCRG